MTTEPRRRAAYLTREEGEIPIRTHEWPRLVKLLGAWPAIQQALQLEARGLTAEEAAQLAGVRIETVRGWLRATRSTAEPMTPAEQPLAR